MHIDYEALEDEYEHDGGRQPIRRNSNPVNGHHDLQRRTENGQNRLMRQARRNKRQAQES